MPVVLLFCNGCHESKPHYQFYRSNRGRFGRTTWCKPCMNDAHRKTMSRHIKTPRGPRNPKSAIEQAASRILASSRVNAYNKGLEHTISRKDLVLPEICPYLGIRIDYRKASERGRLRSWDGPNIDRIDPTRGYVPGNVQIISDLANRMKTNATVEQLLAFAEGVLRLHGS